MFYICKYYCFVCDDCGLRITNSKLSKAQDIRRYGWAISKDYKKCYCPDCALKHRNVGRKPRSRYWSI